MKLRPPLSLRYTKRFIDGEVTLAAQEAGLRASFARVRAASDAVLLEGTGHVGVGAIVGLSNARVAALLGADVVLVANGGLGKAFDELELNRALCEASGVRVRGVVLNKVLPDKVAMVRDYFGRTLAQECAPAPAAPPHARRCPLSWNVSLRVRALAGASSLPTPPSLATCRRRTSCRTR